MLILKYKFTQIWIVAHVYIIFLIHDGIIEEWIEYFVKACRRRER